MTDVNETSLYGISNCDTVRKARKWCQANELDVAFVDFRKDGLELVKVEQWLEKLDWQVLLNKRGTTWRKLDKAEQDSVTADNVATLLCREPTLIKRPVLEHNGTVQVGFKPEQYAKTLLPE